MDDDRAGLRWSCRVPRATIRCSARRCAVAATLLALGACHPQAGPTDADICTIAGDDRAVLRAVVHTVSRHHASVISREMLEVAVDRLADAGVVLVIDDAVVHSDLPASYSGQALDRWAVPDAVNIFLFVTVQAETGRGPAEVKGSYLGDRMIAISGNLGTWDTLAHEIGHMLGLRDVDDPRSVMGQDRFWEASFTPRQAASMRRKLLADMPLADMPLADSLAPRRGERQRCSAALGH